MTELNNAGAAEDTGQEDPLEESMATHCSILVWSILWTEEAMAGYSPWGHKELDMTELTKHANIRYLCSSSGMGFDALGDRFVN